jgi:hypothetical protein
MCMTSAPAKLSNTLIYSGSAIKDDKEVHVLAYQNNAISVGPNAMIIPFPTSDEMDEKNIIDTRLFKSFLKDITAASQIQRLSRGFSLNVTKGASAASFAKVFDVGSYTVVLAKKASQVPEALTRVPEYKRPTITTKFLLGFSDLYKDQPIAICCWDGEIEAEPLLWWYPPKDKSNFFIPTMDAHDGNAPRLTDVVQTDHIISVGSAQSDRVGHHYKVRYTDPLTKEITDLLPTYVYGMKLGSTYKNGDMFVDINNMAVGSESFKDCPKAVRGVSFVEANFQSRKFEMAGWG